MSRTYTSTTTAVGGIGRGGSSAGAAFDRTGLTVAGARRHDDRAV